MCGFVGWIGQQGERLADAEKRLALDRLAPRGPDAEGVWEAPGVWLGHRRLAVVDLDARANQPMSSRCGRYRLVFNGEIYNFRSLRRALEAAHGPIPWRTESDTEVILEGFLREGEQWFSRLRGMFALAIWDSTAHRLTVARDPLGIKPLYYAEHPRGVAIASTVKTLLALGCDAAPDSRGWASFFLWGYVQEPLTPFRAIRSLEPGCIGVWQKGRWDFRPFVDREAPWMRDETLDPDELTQHVRRSVQESIAAHLVSDVPMGVLLSGGIDSTTVAAVAAEAGVATTGFTIAFPEWQGRPQDESPLAALAAKTYGYEHRISLVTEDAFVRDLPQIFAAMDQPSLDGYNTWYAARAVAQSGYKVALSGLGGDELFAGYPSFRTVPRRWGQWQFLVRCLGVWTAERLVRFIGRIKRREVWQHVSGRDGRLTAFWFLDKAVFYPEEIPTLLRLLDLEPVTGDEARQLAQCGDGVLGSTVKTIGFCETWCYMQPRLLRDSDWASMAHGVELRVPLADWQLLDALIPYQEQFYQGVGKLLLSRTPHSPLPRDFLARPKWGFVTPIMEWLHRRHDWHQENQIAGLPLYRHDRKFALWVFDHWQRHLKKGPEFQGAEG